MAIPERRAQPASVQKHTFVCAWCNVLLSASPDPGRDTLNYGICPECLEAQLKALVPARRTPETTA